MTDGNPVIVFPSRGVAEIQNREVPQPGPGEVLVRNHRSVISIGTEMTAFSGDYPAGSSWEKFFPYPFTAGYATAGEVVGLGSGVEPTLLGERVATTAPHARFAAVPLADLRVIQRPEVSMEEAPFFILAQIALRGIRLSRVAFGESATVYGLGLLGYFVANLCRIAGAAPIIAVDNSDFRLGLLAKDPAIVTVNPEHQNLAAIIAERTGGRMADIVFEVTGNAKLIPTEFQALHEQGRFVMVSSPSEKTLFDFHDLCNRPSHTIIGAHNYSHPAVATAENPWTMQRHSQLFFDLIADGKLDVKRIISHRVNWRKAPAIYSKLKKDRSDYMGIVINWEDEV